MRNPDAATRERVLEAFRVLPEGTAISSLGLAWLCGCAEAQARAAVSWLTLGGLVELAGEHPRRDRRGRRFQVRLYRWTGREAITRVRHRPEDRRREREAVTQVDIGAMALAWLSRPPPGRSAGPG